jgi:hypothetical protein
MEKRMPQWAIQGLC